ncbi:MAG: hypothetical protein ACTSYM_03130 [Candidatus Baldrarchaeia archaeon]
MTEKKVEKNGEGKERSKAYLFPYVLYGISIIVFICTPAMLIKFQPSVWVPILLVNIVVFLIVQSLLKE